MLSRQQFDITSLHKAYENGVTAEDVVTEVFRRIDAINDPGIFLHLDEQERILSEARDLGKFDPISHPLWGIPYVVKDNIDVGGMPTTVACPEFTNYPEKDAFSVSLLRDAGALVIGKTNLDQFATGLVGLRSPYPAPRNAIRPDLVPGGSSSGSAIAVATGIVSFALGTDTAGSGRVPAALNGIVGLKPSLGLISSTGVVPACRTLDTVSILATNVADAWSVLSCTALHDENDSFAQHGELGELTPPPPNLRVAVPDKNSIKFFDDLDQTDSFARSLDSLQELDAEICEHDFEKFYQAADLLYEGVWVVERYHVVEELLRKDPDCMDPVVKSIIEKANSYSALDAFRDFYRLQDLKRETEVIFKNADMLCVPSVPCFFSLNDLKKDPIVPNSRLGTYTNFVNLLDLCGIAVPVAPRRDGLPGSITLIAPAGHDGAVSGFALKLQMSLRPPIGATDWSLPNIFFEPDSVSHSEIEIAVVGAHMSGMPLNYQLMENGARFLRSDRTNNDYKLYCLSDYQPPRPGLIKISGGSSIELEIWAMPKSNFGAFMGGIPHPLGIGTISLASGDTVQGFICESIGILEAIDITSYGGWREYINSS